MDRFGYADITDNVNGDKIHRLDNILTLDPGMHDHFDRLKIWFERTVSILLFSLYRVGTEISRMCYTSTRLGQQIGYRFARNSTSV